MRAFEVTCHAYEGDQARVSRLVRATWRRASIRPGQLLTFYRKPIEGGRIPCFMLAGDAVPLGDARALQRAVRAAAGRGPRVELREATEDLRALGGEELSWILQVWAWQSRLAVQALLEMERVEDPYALAALLLDWTLDRIGFAPAARSEIARRRLRWLGVPPGQAPADLRAVPAFAELLRRVRRSPLPLPARWSAADERRHFPHASLRRVLRAGERLLAQTPAWLEKMREPPLFLQSVVQYHINRLGLITAPKVAAVLAALIPRAKAPPRRDALPPALVRRMFGPGWYG